MRDSMVTGLSVTISVRTELIQLVISFSSAGQLLLKAFLCIYLTCDKGSAFLCIYLTCDEGSAGRSC